jgi:guanylate kinase
MPNNLFIISGPSGVGKGAVIENLKKILPFERVITTSTRSMRPNESQMNPYYFISETEFLKMAKSNKFFEYAKEYNNNYYGVTLEEINRVKNNFNLGIWEIEYKGVITAKKLMPDIIAILINAPLNILEKRIRNRNQVSDEFVKERTAYTKEWLKHKDIYDYEVVNEDGKLADAVQKIADIIKNNLDKKHNLL